MNFKQFWKDAKSRAKAMSGVDAVKTGFFGGTGIGPVLGKLAKAPADKRVALAKEAVKAIDLYTKNAEGKKLDEKQKKSVAALEAPLTKMRKLLKDFSDGKLKWEELELTDEPDDDVAEDGGRGMVVSIDPKDKVISEATYDIAKQRTLGADASPSAKPGDKDKAYSNVQADEKLKNANFSQAGSNAPIVLLAHGSTPMFQSSKGNVHAVEFGGKSPQVMIDYIAKTLPLSYSGQIYLDGCFTASGKGTLVYAEQVYKGLVKKGYKYLQIKGNLGAAATTHDGKELVTPADVKRYLQDLQAMVNKLEPLYTRLKKKWEDERTELVNRVKQLSKTGSKEELQKAIEAVTDCDKRREGDAELAKVAKHYEPLLALVNKGDKLAIEGLTGTWGPEALPPKH